jgi:prolipoprotein diacylglyceryltransferase
VDAEHIPAGYDPTTLFHPTFLYESLGNLLICVALILIDRYLKPKPGRLLAMYLVGYSALRFGVESLRIDQANKIAGLRVNTWVSMIVFVGAMAWLIWDARRPEVPELAQASETPESSGTVETPEVPGPEQDSAD